LKVLVLGFVLEFFFKILQFCIGSRTIRLAAFYCGGMHTIVKPLLLREKQDPSSM
jgi:hypothetical protein